MTIQNDTRKRPVFGISMSGPGVHLNDHFSSEASARAEYTAELEKARVIYGRPGYQWTGKFVEETVPATDGENGTVEGVRFVPLKKDGGKGARRWAVRLYRIGESMADAFMRDRFYCVSA